MSDTEADPADSYRAAGLAEDEVAAVAALAASVGAADPLAPWVAVPRGAARTVLAVLDRFTDRVAEAGP